MITEDETYSLQLLIKAFKMWSTELQISTERRCECVCVSQLCCEIHMSSSGINKPSTFRPQLRFVPAVTARLVLFSLYEFVCDCVSGNRLCHTHNSIATKQYTVTKHNRYVHNIRTKPRFGDGCGHSAV